MPRYNCREVNIMTYIASPSLTEYTVVFKSYPRPEGSLSFRRIYANTLEEAAKGIYHLPNASNIIEVVDCFQTIRNQPESCCV